MTMGYGSSGRMQVPDPSGDPALLFAQDALIVCLRLLTAAEPARGEIEERALTALSVAWDTAPPSETVRRRQPTTVPALYAAFEERIGHWLPFAEALGLAQVRLTFDGRAEPVCAELLDEMSAMPAGAALSPA